MIDTAKRLLILRAIGGALVGVGVGLLIQYPYDPVAIPAAVFALSAGAVFMIAKG